ncbi:hypothetical protein [Saccharopolyspora shandongensis]|uniref:hypothetical protein n=1 Tax=Saccharopolyspora shandongensis TaxID=418495 RepID=UPI0033E862CD
MKSKIVADFGEEAPEVISLVEDVVGSIVEEEVGESLNSFAEQESGERLAAAVVIVARGDSSELLDALRLLEVDFRDLLVWAGLGEGDWRIRIDSIFGESL